MNTKRLTKLIALALVVVMALAALAGCNRKPDFKGAGVYTYQDYTTLSPSNWNELTYQDNNDTQIMGYIGSSFFSFDYKFDDNGEILPGEFTVNYNAATKLEDVTAKYAEAWDLDPESTGYAYAITLRDDLKWQNGDPIKAEDFVYTMQEQLNPLFQNYRADSYYNSAQSLVGAKDYAKQGQSGWFMATEPYGAYTSDLADELIFKLAVADPEGEGMDTVTAYLRADWGFPDSYDTKAIGDYFATNYAAYFPNLTGDKLAAMEGKTVAEILADAELGPVFTEFYSALSAAGPLYCTVTNYTFPAYDWVDAEGNPQVGIFVGDNELELVIVLAKALDLLNDDGSLTYKAAYNMSSLPLVHKATYEANKVAPTAGSTLWTSTYCSSVESTMSWGPYMLTEFQSGKYYIVERNENWYGYNMEANKGLYQTDRVYCETIGEWNTAWLKFQAGEIEGIGIDVSIADEYKNSSRAYYTPTDFVGSLQLQSSAKALQSRGEQEGVNKMLMAYTDFRKALSLAVNRDDYNAKCTTASLAGYGLFNSMHYNDVANGGVYRNSDDAKQVLCDVYGVNVADYPSLDDAVAAVTGYNVAMARELVTSAYNQAVADGVIDGDDRIKFTFGSGAITEAVQRRYDYLVAAWTEMFVGTPIEGRVEFELADKGTSWANDFRAGAYDICMGGWTGAAWDPGYFLLAYLDDGYMYSAAWDTTTAMMTFTMKGVGENGADITETMSLYDWYLCLNGDDDAKYDWSSNALEESQRTQLIAALEKEILSVYYTVPLQNEFSAALLSHKVDYITYEYNTFMGYGGMKYMRYNYDDAQWAELLWENDGQLNYKN